MQIRWSTFPITLVILLLLFVTVVVSPVWGQENAADAISSAKNTILTGYNAAKEAEAAGANITVLVATLNEAGSLLSQAELAYATGDFDVALDFAIQSQNILSNFVGEANDLKETAMHQQNLDFLVNVVGSIVGTFAVVVAGVGTWIFLKRKYEPTGASVSEFSRV